MIHGTLVGLKHTSSHPLAREVHFHIILLALKIIQYSTVQSDRYKWKLKDLTLSAALGWFRFPPRLVYLVFTPGCILLLMFNT